MSNVRIARWSAGVTFPAAMALGFGVLVAPSASASAPVSASFTYSPHTQTWTVPDGVTSVHAVLDGAGGGRGAAPAGDTGGGGGGGAGGQVTTDLLVTPGQVLTIAVGQGGSDGQILSSGGGGAGGTGIEPGGNGGSPDNFLAGGGGGGGGASAIFSGSTALAVAGGGGGGGGGAATIVPAHGGRGGTASAGAGEDGSGTGHGSGGAGGAASGPTGDNGWSAPAVSFAGGGGGGGGGWPKGGAAGGAGGAGPGTGGGGGAGASGVDPNRTANTTLGTSPLTASVAADGRVSLTYQPPGLPTVTTVTASPAAPVYGQPVTLTIRVTSGGQPVDTDSQIVVSDFDRAFVSGQFSDLENCFRGFQLGSLLADATVTCTLANPTSGGHDWYVHFVDLDGTYARSTGDVVVHVDQAATTTTLASDPSAADAGQPITLRATVARAASAGDGLSTDYAGTVTFRDGSTVLCQDVAERSGQPSTFDCALPAGLAGGGHDLSATWTPDAAYSGFDPSTASLHQEVNLGATQIALASSAPSGSDFGAPVSFTATVASEAPGAGLPAGTVQFSVDGTALGSPVALTSATASSPPVPDLAPGTHAVAASYSGDAGHLPSGPADLAQVVRPGTASVTVTSSAPAGTALGAPVSFTAAVGPVAPASVPPTGSVQFAVDGTPFGSAVQLTGGSANTAAISGLAPGAHTVTAAYAGDSDYAAATSPALTQQVDAGALAVSTPQLRALAVTVPTIVANTSVTGPVTVSPGASIAVTGARINGPVLISGASSVRICGSTIRGPVVIIGTTGPVLVGNDGSQLTGCAPNTFWGPVVVVGGQSGTVFDGNRVHGPVTIAGGNAGTEIGGNAITGPLACRNNTPRPVNGGRPNTVSGARLGQCAVRGF